MKIAITCDLHLGITPLKDITSLCQHIEGHQPDAVVIAGDIGVDPKDIETVLSEFRNRFKNVIIVLGNHDIWCDGNGHNSKEKFYSSLPKLITQHGCHYLEAENFLANGVALVGSYLHYDYSAKDTVGPAAGLPDAYFEKNKINVNNDGRFLIGLPRDIDFAREIGDAFLSRLHLAQEDPAVQSIIVVTHVPCMEEQITRKPHDAKWSFGTAYFGNLTYQDAIYQCSKVRYVISGHSHQWENHLIQSSDRAASGAPPIRAITIGSDYYNPQCIMIDV